MQDAMDIQEVDDSTLRVVLAGRLDSNMVDRIESSLRARIDASPHHVIVDLYEVGFAASLAIRMFVAIARRLHGTGRLIVLFGAQPLVREVFDHVALDDLIPIVPEAADALDRVAGVAR